MKSISTLFTAFFLCYSCTTANKSKYLEFEDSKLEVQEKQDFESDLLGNLKTIMSEDFNTTVVVSKSEILKIDDHLYLRTYYNNDFVSTTLLNTKSNVEGELRTLSTARTTTCTSKACASGGGCIPDTFTIYCKPCNRGAKDCVRTTSNEILRELDDDGWDHHE